MIFWSLKASKVTKIAIVKPISQKKINTYKWFSTLSSSGSLHNPNCYFRALIFFKIKETKIAKYLVNVL